MKRKVWGFYEMDFSELSGETIEQQKKRMSQLFIMKAYSQNCWVKLMNNKKPDELSFRSGNLKS